MDYTSNNSNQSFEPIAIVGLGSIFPGSENPTEYWKNIVESKDLISEVPPSHWLVEDYYDPDPTAVDKTYCKRGAFIPTIEFDPVEFGVPPTNIPAIDTSQLLALVVAKQVLTEATDSKYQNMDLSRVSVILGAAALEALQYVAGRMQRPVWQKALREAGLLEPDIKKICDSIANSYTGWQENTFPGLLGNVIAGRIANRFNLGGTNCATDAACAGSLSALSMAISELHLKTADMVITGGVDTLNDIVMFMCFSKTQALSFSGDCRPFSSKADGTILGEGLGMFALKRLKDAEKNQDKIYAVIRGIGTSSDGRSKSIYAPLPQGQSKAILRAYELAGYKTDTVELIEAHGTGTRAGDAAEFAGLNQAFSEMNDIKKRYCALGSVKSQIGHTKSAAGAAGLLKAIMALHHKMLPPTIKIEQPNTELDLENSPFYLNTELRPWVRDKTHPRRAGVSSFGFGGSNFHVCLEEYTGSHRAKRLRTSLTELIVLAADNPEKLIQLANQKITEWQEQKLKLTAIARISQENYDSTKLARLAIVAADLSDLQQKIIQAVTAIKENPQKLISLPVGIYYGYAINHGRVAFLFPGQGSQYSSMGAQLAMTFDSAMTKWDQAAEFNFPDNQYLHDIVFPKPAFNDAERQASEQKLTMTQWAQPALAVTSLTQLALLKELNINADCVAGHSFGELTALHAAGVMDEAIFLSMACKRGEIMQAATSIPGGMLSVMHPAEKLITLLKTENIMLTPANYNSPRQLVLSGAISEIEKAEQLLQQQGIKYRRLAVATGFHSHLVKSCSQSFLNFLKKLNFKKAKIPVYSNQTAQPYPENPAKVANYLAEQLANPVKFQDIIENLYQTGVRTFIEVGPQAILTGLVNQCLEQREFFAINLDRKGEHGLTSLWNGLGKLFVTGLNPQFCTLWKEYQAMAPPVQSSAKKLSVKINGTNFGRPYPPPEGKKVLPKVNQELAKSTETILPSSNAVSKQPVPNVVDQQKSTMQNQHLHLIKNTRGATMSQFTNSAFFQMYQESQRQMIDAHNNYQRLMAETHVAFLNSITQIAQQAVGGTEAIQPQLLSQAPAIQPTARVVATPSFAANTTMQPTAQVAAHRPIHNPAPAPTFTNSPAATAQTSVAPAAVAMGAAQAAAVIKQEQITETKLEVLQTNVATAQATVLRAEEKTVQAPNLKDLILEIVVEKTGYPKEMLSMDMAIEADLGIDSIKRVEILSTLSERAPHLPEVNPAQLAELQTLGDIVNYMEKK